MLTLIAVFLFVVAVASVSTCVGCMKFAADGEYGAGFTLLGVVVLLWAMFFCGAYIRDQVWTSYVIERGKMEYKVDPTTGETLLIWKCNNL